MNSKLFLFSFLLLIGCLNQIASDIYAPAITHITYALHTEFRFVQFSMVVFMFGAALSLLIYGPLSDIIGRKIPLIIGLSISGFGCILAILSFNIQMLLIARLIQGLGTGACAGLWRSIFRDVFAGEELAKYGSYLGIFVTFMIPAAPLLGAYLQHFFAWQSIFVFILLYVSTALFIVVRFYKETFSPQKNNNNFILTAYNNFRTLLTNKTYLGTTLSVLLTYGAFFTWFTTAPVLFINDFHFTSTFFGWFSFIGGGTVYIIGGWLNGRIVKRVGMAIMLRIGWLLIIVSGLELLFNPVRSGIVLSGLLLYFGSTLIWPNAFAIAITPFSEIAGSAGTLYSFMQIIGAAFIGALTAHFSNNQSSFLAAVFIISAGLAWLTYDLFVANHFKISKD